jgi:hypothetical protein
MDWTSTIAFATKMISDYGRDIKVQKLSGTAADPNRPWRGQGEPFVEKELVVKACFVPPTVDEFGRKIASEQLLASVEQIALIAPTTENIEAFNSILDVDNSRHRIDWAWTLKPGSDILLYAFGVCR